MINNNEIIRKLANLEPMITIDHWNEICGICKEITGFTESPKHEDDCLWVHANKVMGNHDKYGMPR